MTALVLESVETDGPVVEYNYRCHGRVRRFFSSEPFTVEYGVDISAVPESILTIPWLANACPVAWATGADVVVPELDREFGAALDRIQSAMREMHSAFMTGGEVHGEAVVDPVADRFDANDRFDDSALLFSGGVDSLTSYVRHREKAPYLVSVHGADIDRDNLEAWRHNRTLVEDFAGSRGIEPLFVGADMHGFLDGQLLLAHYRQYLDDNWFTDVQHGLGLLGLCAPLSYVRGIGTVYIAATHTEEFNQPWGSHPKIDDEVAWSGATAVHDGYKLSRQEKIGVLADYIEREAPNLRIRSCHESATGGNCNDCEKCARTVVGLLLAGLDPTAHGYEVKPDTFRCIREEIEAGTWRLGHDERFMWEDLQSHAERVHDEGTAHTDLSPTVVADSGPTAADSGPTPSRESGGDALVGESGGDVPSQGHIEDTPSLEYADDALAGKCAEDTSAREHSHEGIEPLLGWLVDADFEQLQAKSTEPAYREQIRLIARKTPYPVYQALAPALTYLRERSEGPPLER